MSKKLASLQQALDNAAGQPKPKKTAPTPKEMQPKKEATRQDKENVSVWLHPDFKRSLRLAQLSRPDKVYLDDLVAEALNDLFRKCDVPTVTHN